MAPLHVSVMAEQVVEWLGVHPDGIYLDCTVGAGGHARRILERCTGTRLVGLDRDPAAIEAARECLVKTGRATLVHRNYDELAQVLAELAIERVDGVLIDAGISSMQLDTPERGFSFQQDGPLDMRMDPSQGPTAADYLADVDPATLTAALRTCGDVKPAGRIARLVVERARQGRLETTGQLVQAIADALPFVTGVPAEVRTVFQAIRIAVNDELGGLDRALEQAIEALAPEGRIVVISFHSGEDRIVKSRFREASRARRVLRPDGRLDHVVPAVLRVLTRRPVTPGEQEIQANPRAASAKLRAAVRCG